MPFESLFLKLHMGYFRKCWLQIYVTNVVQREDQEVGKLASSEECFLMKLRALRPGARVSPQAPALLPHLEDRKVVKAI